MLLPVACTWIASQPVVAVHARSHARSVLAEDSTAWFVPIGSIAPIPRVHCVLSCDHEKSGAGGDGLGGGGGRGGGGGNGYGGGGGGGDGVGGGGGAIPGV